MQVVLYFIFCILLLYASSIYINNVKLRCLIIIFIMLPAVFRGFIGPDTKNYIYQFYIDGFSNEYEYNINLFSIFFYLLAKLTNWPFLITIISAVTSLYLLIIINKKNNSAIFILLYSSLFLVGYNYSQIRQGLADLLYVFLLFKFRFNNSNVKKFFYIFPILIHPTLLITFLSNLFIEKGRILFLLMILVSILCTLWIFYYFDFNVINKYLSYFFVNNVNDGFQDFKIYPFSILKSIIILFLLYAVNAPLNKFFTSLLLISICILLGFLPILTRVLDSILIFLLAYISFFFKRTTVTIFLITIITLIGMLGTVNIFLSPKYNIDIECGQWTPYRLLDTDDLCFNFF